LGISGDSLVNEQLRVVELGDGIASAYAAKLLGDHGADVVKVEGPEGDPARRRGPFRDGPSNKRTQDPEESGLFLALNVNKRGITMDLTAAGVEGLLDWADLVVHNFSPRQAATLGLDVANITDSHPELVVLAITAFGHSGPYAEYEAEELTLTNAGGWANLCPSTHTDETLPPLKVFGDQCALMSGIAGATAALAVTRQARESGVGEYIDFSQQAYVASVLEAGIPAYSYKEEVASRHLQRGLIPWRIFNVVDGSVFIVCIEQDQWERLVEFMGHPEWADLELFADGVGRAENQDLVHTFVQEFVGEWRADDLYHAAQKHRICVAPVMHLKEIAKNEHLRARNFFTEVTRARTEPIEMLAAAAITKSGRAALRLPAPRLGEHNAQIDFAARPTTVSHNASSIPLAGVRVLDMTWAWAGPFCSMNLAHLGAEVLRIESEKRADLYRRLPIFPEDWEPTLNVSGMFNQWNQGKSSIAIDLAHPQGIAIVKDLIKQSDVVVQNFATGVMDRLGLGYAELKNLNPKIILASISGYGQSGPYSQYMGYGPAMPPLTGLAAATGYVDGGPEEIGLSMPDPTAGITAAMAIVSALARRDSSGEGDHIDVSLWEATGVLNIEGWMQYVLTGSEPKRIGNRSLTMSPHGCFPCAPNSPAVKPTPDAKVLSDTAWVSVACRTDEEWSKLAHRIDPELAQDARFDSLHARKQHEDELEATITAWTKNRDRWDITTSLQADGIAAFPTMTSQDIVEDPHLNERGFIERLDHPEVGKRAHTGIPWRFRNRANGVASPAPCLGADTDRHLRELLQLSDQEITDLYTAQIIGV
jgi:crotonobetainyl-CoA:carnitine CoA-transferase CaiB-like acyl-CoA transferase